MRTEPKMTNLIKIGFWIVGFCTCRVPEYLKFALTQQNDFVLSYDKFFCTTVFLRIVCDKILEFEPVMVNSTEVATVYFFRCCNKGSKRPKFTRLSRHNGSDYNFFWGNSDSFLCDNILKTEPFFGRVDQSCIEMGSLFPHIGFHTVWIFYRPNLHSFSFAHLTSFLVHHLCDSSFSDRTLKSKQIVPALIEIVNLKSLTSLCRSPTCLFVAEDERQKKRLCSIEHYL